MLITSNYVLLYLSWPDENTFKLGTSLCAAMTELLVVAVWAKDLWSEISSVWLTVHTCYTHCKFSLLIDFARGWLYKRSSHRGVNYWSYLSVYPFP